jgi:hypothetical protein
VPIGGGPLNSQQGSSLAESLQEGRFEGTPVSFVAA